LNELRKNDRVRLTVSGMTLQGQGVARHEGLAVFIPAAAVGDELSVTITKREKRLAYAKIDEILQPGAARITQDCGAYPRCGGCVFRHITYEEELRVKAQAVSDALFRLGKLTPEIRPILPAPQTEHYRNKAQYPVGEFGGQLRSGFFAPRSHRLIPCEDCRLQPPEFAALTRVVLEHAARHGIAPYDETTHSGTLRHIYLRQSALTGQALVCLVTNSGAARDIESHATPARVFPHADELYATLQAAAPICGIVQNINTQRTNVVLGEKTQLLFGDDALEDSVLGIALRVSPQSFYQVNHAQAERLYALAGDESALSGGETVLELHCGSGLLGLTMARRCRELIGVDLAPAAIRDAKENARRNGIENARFICADANDAANLLCAEGLRPNVVLLDPPRTGCGTGLVGTVCKLAPPRIVYISCNPATLARDCSLLAENGYTLLRVTPVDMFPRTAHVESVALLQRADA
jgi:23S rRNA (uracil1939-C5)-methyltransferase